MKYYSTNHTAPEATLAEAVIHGLAPDRGLYMPERIERLPESFFRNIENLSFREISFEVAKAFFGEDINEEELRDIVYDTLSFDCPVVNVSPGIWALELFHGPTLAFKDVGARFMARVLSYFIRTGRPASMGAGGINVLVATSGDTGSAVANGFLGVDGIHVHVLYPKGKVSPIQESQFTTLGRNITAIEVDGTFDDCQALVKDAFADAELNRQTSLTSANSINVARFLPQAFYYFNAYARLKEQAGIHSEVVGHVLDAVAEIIHVDDDMEIYTSGATNIFKYPELSDKQSAQEIISAFEEKQQLADLVTETLASEDNHGIQVYIGDETPVKNMKDCSVVTATYELGEGMKGTIGIIGPKRMDYEHVMKTLKTLQGELDAIYNKNPKE